jgi:hypothetical protein
MKIAICLSGAIRYPHIGLKSIENIFPNDEVKIFIHTWKISNKEEFLKTVFGLEFKEYDNMIETQFNFLDKYNYEKLLIEDYESKKCKFQEIYNSLNLLSFESSEEGITPRYDVGPISMHYSINMANNLKSMYEKENNMTFDVVIRMRFDSDFENKKLNVDEYPNTLNIPKGEDWCGGINDQFAFGPSSVMNDYSNFYKNITEIEGVPYHPETMLLKYLDMKKININRCDFRVRINNNIDFRRIWYPNLYQ